MELIELFNHKVKLPRITYRKLGKEQAHGQVSGELFEVDERLKGKKLMEILIHEGLHYFKSGMEENEVRLSSRQLTELLWREGFRKVDSNDQ